MTLGEAMEKGLKGEFARHLYTFIRWPDIEVFVAMWAVAKHAEKESLIHVIPNATKIFSAWCEADDNTQEEMKSTENSPWDFDISESSITDDCMKLIKEFPFLQHLTEEVIW